MTTPPPSIQPVSSILVVDDEPDLRTLYELTLLREGHNVRTAASLADAREALAAETFSVVITDMRLPDGLGLALLHELRSAQRSERCVVMTAYGSAENAVEALKTGAFDYLTKPVDLAQFRQVVASDTAAVDVDDGDGGVVLGDAEGTVELVLDADATAALALGSMVFDLEVESAGGEVTRIASGTVILDKEVTR